jgi:hypothetical protein
MARQHLEHDSGAARCRGQECAEGAAAQAPFDDESEMIGDMANIIDMRIVVIRQCDHSDPRR